MIKKVPDRLFLIIASLLIIGITFFTHVHFRSSFSSKYRSGLFKEFVSSLENKNFNPQKYWEFRERYGDGTFLRDQNSTGFFETFRIVKVNEGLTPLFYYESSLIRSLDGLISYEKSEAINSIQNEFPGEVVAKTEDYILIKAGESDYIFVFVKDIETMRQVVGMFDYLPEEMELLDNKLWYNATYIKVY